MGEDIRVDFSSSSICLVRVLSEDLISSEMPSRVEPASFFSMSDIGVAWGGGRLGGRGKSL